MITKFQFLTSFDNLLFPNGFNETTSGTPGEQEPEDPNQLLLRWTPLHLAAREGHTDVVELLVQHNAKHDAKDCGCLLPSEA